MYFVAAGSELRKELGKELDKESAVDRFAISKLYKIYTFIEGIKEGLVAIGIVVVGMSTL